MGGGQRQQAGEIKHGPRQEDRPEAQPHDQRAGDRLQQAPGEVLDRDGQREVGDAERQVARDRLKKQTERLANAHAERQHDRGADQDRHDRTKRAPIIHGRSY